jgi:hypothetical protein
MNMGHGPHTHIYILYYIHIIYGYIYINIIYIHIYFSVYTYVYNIHMVDEEMGIQDRVNHVVTWIVCNQMPTGPPKEAWSRAKKKPVAGSETFDRCSLTHNPHAESIHNTYTVCYSLYNMM